ncbi:hypothetical protein RUA4292_03854 [Ruegeria atlantica]|uniref:Uncharacterized protein n=1 Tax=Ruegeria atlantica TaxID=81569 RepID=A0A0P1EH51_9RHOB|nr:hypothetical protein RUA4292_03854 [Ruegeria atlantica]
MGGNGMLSKHLMERGGHICIHASDIEPQRANAPNGLVTQKFLMLVTTVVSIGSQISSFIQNWTSTFLQADFTAQEAVPDTNLAIPRPYCSRPSCRRFQAAVPAS